MPHKLQKFKCKKALYLTQKSAERALEKIINSTDKRLSTPVRFYYCDLCQGYHLTSKIKPQEDTNCLKYLDEWNKIIET